MAYREQSSRPLREVRGHIMVLLARHQRAVDRGSAGFYREIFHVDDLDLLFADSTFRRAGAEGGGGASLSRPSRFPLASLPSR